MSHNISNTIDKKEQIWIAIFSEWKAKGIEDNYMNIPSDKEN